MINRDILLETLVMVIALVAVGVIVASLWNLDWAIWEHSMGIYYPFPGLYGSDAGNGDLGFWVNLQYYQVFCSSIVLFVCGYVLGYRRSYWKTRGEEDGVGK